MQSSFIIMATIVRHRKRFDGMEMTFQSQKWVTLTFLLFIFRKCQRQRTNEMIFQMKLCSLAHRYAVAVNLWQSSTEMSKKCGNAKINGDNNYFGLQSSHSSAFFILLSRFIVSCGFFAFFIFTLQINPSNEFVLRNYLCVCVYSVLLIT